ncbi:hypothetical protein EST38_g4659 [Candolleomyces aberdarensis]|uniref:Uncharacterized protein n=1 Tax=Candolleomyces aberdarensis TaxID=2316362 RepID=A0A4Q2DML8_9AGAR|nr:hypothetical protein EST38_g4659 [Candolleomyces aberdarensis]
MDFRYQEFQMLSKQEESEPGDSTETIVVDNEAEEVEGEGVRRQKRMGSGEVDMEKDTGEEVEMQTVASNVAPRAESMDNVVSDTDAEVVCQTTSLELIASDDEVRRFLQDAYVHRTELLDGMASDEDADVIPRTGSLENVASDDEAGTEFLHDMTSGDVACKKGSLENITSEDDRKTLEDMASDVSPEVVPPTGSLENIASDDEAEVMRRTESLNKVVSDAEAEVMVLTGSLASVAYIERNPWT